MKNKQNQKQNIHLWQFLRGDKMLLLFLAISGIVFNVGLVFIPIFEGWLIQCFFDILSGVKVFKNMLVLVGFYSLVMIAVQISRYLKRKFVRKIANNMVVRMRDRLYLGILSNPNVGDEGVGELVTRASLDVEIVAEGTRKTLTEFFDTGVLLISFYVTMFIYDWKISLISLLFSPLACIIAELLKKVIYKQTTQYKLASERLSNVVFDRITNESLYRVYGRDEGLNKEYEKVVSDYEKKAIFASVWENTLQPIYNVIAMIGIIFIIYLGGRNVLGVGFSLWNIAVFTTYISCYTKVADKMSKVAKLFNSVQKAGVSWKRLKENLSEKEIVFDEYKSSEIINKPVYMSINECFFGYNENEGVIKGASFSAQSGQIVGVTGIVASGKSTLGKMFLGEKNYSGSITINGVELRDMTERERFLHISYLGHNTELFSDSIKENVLLGSDNDLSKLLEIVNLKEEVDQMENGVDTQVGSFGLRLSGGQKSRVALARTLCHAKNILILDDPFSAVDKPTEKLILENLKKYYGDRLIIIISHRLTSFPTFDKVLWIENGKVISSNHQSLMENNLEYKKLYEIQVGEQND